MKSKNKRMNVEGFADAAVLANRIFLDPLLLCVLIVLLKNGHL